MIDIQDNKSHHSGHFVLLSTIYEIIVLSYIHKHALIIPLLIVGFFAVKLGEYHFNAYQNNLINNLDSVHQKSFIQQLSSLINGPAFFHS